MTTYAGTIIPWVEMRFIDATGAPLVGAKLYSYTAGTSSALPTYSDVDLDVENANPIVTDADGRPTSGAIYLAPAGYKFKLTDADDVELWTRDNVADVGAIFANNFGLEQEAGGKDVTSGYEVLNTDRLVTVDSTGGADPCLINMISATLSQQQVTIKNLGTVALAVTPNGAETIDGVAAAFTVPAAATPTFPAIVLVPDGVSNWWIVGSHGL